MSRFYERCNDQVGRFSTANSHTRNATKSHSNDVQTSVFIGTVIVSKDHIDLRVLETLIGF
jgi:hypothetical protein